MRKPLLIAALMSVALAIVIFAKMKLDGAIKEGRFAEQAPPAPSDDPMANSIDIGVQQDPQKAQGSAVVHSSSGAAKTDVMAALVLARQNFKAKSTVNEQTAKDPHKTAPVIIQAAETLGSLLTLERQNPAYKPEFQAFYLECAKDAEVITVTRVQCLENYVLSKGISGDELERLLSEVDPTVKALYQELQR